MQIVIDIPEEDYKRMKEQSMFGRVDVWKQAIRNGTPLPKGHGRLIDADAEIKKIQDISDRVKRNAPCLDVYDGEIAAMRLATTIIEADTEESEGKLDGDPVDIDKAVEHYEGTLEELKDIDLEVNG